MLEGYHKVFRNFGKKEVIRPVDMPEPALGVGFAETLTPVKTGVRYKANWKAPQVQPILNLDDTNELGSGKQFNVEDFPKTGYLGEGIA